MFSQSSISFFHFLGFLFFLSLSIFTKFLHTADVTDVRPPVRASPRRHICRPAGWGEGGRGGEGKEQGGSGGKGGREGKGIKDKRLRREGGREGGRGGVKEGV